MKSSKLKTQLGGVLAIGMAFCHVTINAQEETTLQQKLMERAAQSKTSPAVKKKMAQHLQSLTESDLVKNALNVGDSAPEFRLKDHLGVERNLSEFLKQGPVIITWYRGGW